MDGSIHENKIKIATLHLEDCATQWHQRFTKSHTDMVITWEEYLVALRARFGHYVYDDPFVDL